MNNKHKLKRIKWGTLITISCLIGIILLNTNAKSLSKSKTKVKKLAEAKTCKVYKNTDFSPKISVTNEGSKIKVDASISKNTDANFWIFVSEGEVYGEISFITEGEFNGKNGYNFDYNLGVETPLAETFVVMVYKDGIADACKGPNKETAKNIAIDYIRHGKFEDMETTIKNNAYIAKGGHNTIEMPIDQPIEDDDSGNTEEEEKIVQEIESISSESGSLTGDGGATTVTNTNLGDLYCSPNTVYKEGVTDGANYYTNNKSYYYKETKTENYCEKTCEETITIKYGPPVATKAGMCFEYKVKVESKVSCKTKWLGDSVPGLKPTKKKLCTIYPYCNGSATYGDQAGPDADFDSCVNKCDNGKYSQQCINKCYKEVYENTDNKKISYDNSTSDNTSSSLLATRTALSDLGMNIKTDFCQSGYNDPTYYKANYDKLVTAMRDKNNGCEYKEVTKGGEIYWSCSPAHNSKNTSSNWQSLGRYYFLTDSKARQTLQSISESCIGENRGIYYRYYIDSNGFKRAYLNSDHSVTCNQPCTWQVSGNRNDCAVSKSERDKEYQDALDKYKKLKSECKAQASCSTNTATFTIKVENVAGSKYKNGELLETKDFGTTYGASIKDGSQATTSGINPIIDTGACYKTNEFGSYSDAYNYMTEWSFPGVWLNNKNGEVSLIKKDSNGWTEKDDSYCTSLNSVSVNTTWWQWAQYTKLADEASYKDSSLTYGGDIDKYNIEAETKNFGHFSWNVKMNCFYAISNDNGGYTPPDTPDPDNPTPTPTPTPDPTPSDNDSPKLDYEARSIDTDEIFSDEVRGSGDDKIIGFNWTAGADENLEVDEGVKDPKTKQKSESYQIKPEELTKDIQTKAANGTTYSDSNLEYEFKLTRKELNDLKKKTLSAFEGSFTDRQVGKSGVKLYTIQQYKSKVVDDLLASTSSSRYRPTTKLCNNWEKVGNTCKKYS